MTKYWSGKKRKNLTGELNPAWKGEDANYFSIHKWIARNFEDPKKRFK